MAERDKHPPGQPARTCTAGRGSAEKAANCSTRDFDFTTPLPYAAEASLAAASLGIPAESHRVHLTQKCPSRGLPVALTTTNVTGGSGFQ